MEGKPFLFTRKAKVYMTNQGTQTDDLPLKTFKSQGNQTEKSSDPSALFMKALLKSSIGVVDKAVEFPPTLKLFELILKLTANTKTYLPDFFTSAVNQIVMKLYNRFCLRTTLRPTDDLEEIIKEQGDYSLEVYDTKTVDGFKLQLHRLRRNGNQNHNTMPVYIQHGLLSSSSDFLLEGGLAYQFANEGRDVWLGNFRGSIFSRRKLREEINDSEFWGHDIDDHATKDLPTMIDFVLEKTGHVQVQYIGHSMGCTSLFILCESMPEFNSKIKEAYLLAPVSDLTNITGLPKNLVPSAEYLMDIMEMFGIYTPFFPRLIPGWSVIGILICQICGYNSINADIDSDLYKLKKIEKFSPSGSTTRSIRQYLRCHREAKLVSNCDKEDTRAYSLSNTTMPVTILYGPHDVFAGRDNMAKMKSDLPNVVGFYEMDEDFGHLDFLWEARPISIILHDLINEGQTPIINEPRATNHPNSERQQPMSIKTLFYTYSKQITNDIKDVFRSVQ